MTCWTHRTKYRASFIAMIVLTFILCMSKVFVGYKENSLSLIADSFHLTSDLAALIIGYGALRFSEQRVDGIYTFGGVRAEVLGAAVNAIFLIAICFSLTVESLKRLVVPDLVEHPEPVLIVGIIGLFTNAVGLFLFRCESCSCRRVETEAKPKLYKKFSTDLVNVPISADCSKTGRIEKKDRFISVAQSTGSIKPSYQLNIHAVFLHILQHVFVAFVVIISALVVMYAKGSWIAYVDPVLSLVVVLYILKTSVPLLKECVLIFMQTVPANLQFGNLKDKLLKRIPEVIGVHELHIWQLAGHEIVGSVHVVFHSHRKYNQNLITSIEDFFLQEGISSITVQPEFSDVLQEPSNERPNCVNKGEDDDCLLICSERKCAYMTCCETPKKMIAKIMEEI